MRTFLKNQKKQYQNRYARLTALCLAAVLLASCAAPAAISGESASQPAVSTAQAVAESAPAAPRTAFRIGSLKGPTTMGLVKLMDDVDKGAARHDYTVSMYGTPDEITPQLVKGEMDIAIVPANLASVLYNKTEGQLQVAAVNSLGVLYMVTTGDDIKSVADLKGKTILTTGKGTTPEYTLNYILKQNGLTVGTDVQVEFYSEATEVATAMQASSGYPIAMLPQPYVTLLQAQMPNLKVVLDMTEECEKISPETGLVTGVIVARKAFVEQNPAAFDAFLEDYTASAAFVNENIDAGAAMVAARGIVPKEEIAKKAIPACKIVSITGAEMQTRVSGYLEMLFAQNPQSVGGALPKEDFYYLG